MNQQYELCFLRARNMTVMSYTPYESMVGVFGHFKPICTKQISNESEVTFAIELPTVVPVSKCLWKK